MLLQDSNIDVEGLRRCLEEVTEKAMPVLVVTTKEGTCSFDIVDFVYNLELLPVNRIFGGTHWYDAETFEVEEVTVEQLLSVWDKIVPLAA